MLSVKFFTLTLILTSIFAVNVKDFGATGDGIIDDTVSVNNAITNITNNGGGKLYFPFGTYKVRNTLRISNVPVVITGDGVFLSKLFWNSDGTDGFLISVWNNMDFEVRDISLHASTISGTAVVVNVTTAIKVKVKININGVDIGSTGIGPGWNGCVHLINATRIVLNQVNCIGTRDNLSFPTNNFGFKVTGTGAPVDVYLSQVRVSL